MEADKNTKINNGVTPLKYVEIMPATPEKRDKRLAFIRLVPKRVIEKMMKKGLSGMRPIEAYGTGIAKREVKTTDFHIPGYNGEILLRLYDPRKSGNIEAPPQSPLAVFFHGGAFMGGGVNACGHYCAAYADKMNEPVLSVEYHLAPEYPFPHGFEDCYAACKWVFANAETLRVDTEQLTLSGDSAGGNFAAGIVKEATEKRDFTVSRLILLYPYTTFQTPKLSMTKIMHRWYLNGADKLSPRISPLNSDISGFPPTLTVICEYDLLAADGKAFAQKLAVSGVDSTCVMFLKTRHAFLDKIGALKQTEELLDFILDWKTGTGRGNAECK